MVLQGREPSPRESLSNSNREARSGRTTASLSDRLGVEAIMGASSAVRAPAYYTGPWADADSEVIRLERLCLELEGGLPGDLNPGNCTTCAWFLRAHLGDARIHGFFAEDNPHSALARYADGHDFALYRDRFVIDPWAVDTLDPGNGGAIKYVHDLADPRDASEILRLYGPRELWGPPRNPSPEERIYEDDDNESLVELVSMGKVGAAEVLQMRGLPLPQESARAYAYFTQCDRFRREYENGESLWHEMMNSALPTHSSQFEHFCDLPGMLDEGETWDTFTADNPDARLCRSYLAGLPCIFIQVRGFEFIFMRPEDQARLKRTPETVPDVPRHTSRRNGL
jgi:hypothetical protein